MYRLLIVDDEEIEREGMVEFIPWQKYDIEIVGTAWNGVEAFEQIQEKNPDIVLTDIKMPIMNGIELIKKTREILPDIEFIVLSGYGEYEFTSQAMEEGVRHYVLKPSDEEKIVAVLDKVKEEINKKRSQKMLTKEYQYTVHKLMPHAKSQIFQNMLLCNAQMKADYQLFMDEIGNELPDVVVLAFHLEGGFDYLEQFAVQNIIGELLGKKHVLLATVLQKDVYFLINAKTKAVIEAAVVKTKKEFAKFKSNPIYCALSEESEWEQIGFLYMQVHELLQIANMEKRDELLHYEVLTGIRKEAMAILDYSTLKEVKSFSGVVFEIYLLFLKMELRQYDYSQKKEICQTSLRLFYGEDLPEVEDDKEKEWKLLETMVNVITEKQCTETDDEERMRHILLVVYKNIREPQISIQFLCKEVFFMNEDYFGRMFLKAQRQKFSTFLLHQRVEIAKRLLQYNPEIKTARLANLAGYSPDGQYFSKVFRKMTGLKPSEYRELMKREKGGGK